VTNISMRTEDTIVFSSLDPQSAINHRRFQRLKDPDFTSNEILTIWYVGQMVKGRVHSLLYLEVYCSAAFSIVTYKFCLGSMPPAFIWLPILALRLRLCSQLSA